jgi:hypothetical protein
MGALQGRRAAAEQTTDMTKHALRKSGQNLGWRVGG